MKILKPLLTLAAIALLITSCNKTDEFAPEQNSTFPADGVIRVATSVANPQTRAGMTSDNLENFQMRIINSVNSDYSYYANMSRNAGVWSSFVFGEDNSESLTLLWQNNTNKIKVSAVSHIILLPDQGLWEDGHILFIPDNQEEENVMQAADVLYMAEKEIDPSKDLVNGKIQIELKHRLSKLNLTVKMGTEFNKLTDGTATNLISDIIVGGTFVSGIWFMLNDDDMTPYKEPPYDYTIDINPWHDIAAYKAGEGDVDQAIANYECILIPQSVDANVFNVSFKIGDRYFSWSSPSAVELLADTQYNLTLNVGKDVVTVGGFTATPWIEEPVQDLGTE